MTPDDVDKLLSFQQRMFKRQEFDEDELVRWAIALREVRSDYATAEEAAVRVLQRQAFVEPHELIGEILVIQRDRQERQPVYEVPDFGDDDKYRPALKALLQGISDGGQGMAPMLGEIEAGDRAEGGASPASVEARALAHGKTPEFIRQRDEAMPYPCEQCKASPGEVCVNAVDGRPVEKAPAHPPRLEAAGLIKPQPRPSREELLAFLRSRMTEEELRRLSDD